MKKRATWIVVVGLGLTLAACSTPSSPATAVGQQLSSSVLDQATPVPTAYGQALVVRDILTTAGASGKATDDTLKPKSLQVSADALAHLAIVSAPVVDLFGKPFYQLSIVGDPATINAQDFTDTLTRFDATANYQVYATGASTARNLYAFQFDGRFVRQLEQTLQAAGSLDHLLSPQGSVIYLVDRQGRTWNVASATVVDAAQLVEDQAAYVGLVREYEADKAGQEAFRAAWATVLDPSDPSGTGIKPQTLGRNILAPYTRSDGNLDLGKLSMSVEKSASVHSLWTDDQVDAQGWLLNPITVRFRIMNMSTADNQAAYTNNTSPETTNTWLNIRARDIGNRQNVSRSYPVGDGIQLPAGGQWGIRYFNPSVGGFSAAGNITGCSPRTFVRMLTIISGDGTDLGSRLAGVSLDAGASNLIQDLEKPVQADGLPSGYYEPKITKLMGGGQFVNGTLVTPWSTIDGANAWLNAKNIPYHMEGAYSFNPTGVVGSLLTSVNPVSLIGFTQMTWNAESIVRRSIWNDGHPAMMLFAYDDVPGNENLGHLGAHYVPTYAYKIYENPFYTDVYTYSDFVTDPYASDPPPYGWINITNHWSTYRGAYGIFANPVAQPPVPPRPPRDSL